MRLDRILQVLLPHDEHFYGFFEESALNILQAADTMLRLTHCPRPEWDAVVAEVSRLEHEGDRITHRIFSELSGTFVTPFDPEDIHLLASALDDILDNMDGSARRLLLYKIPDCPPAMANLIRCLRESVSDLSVGIHLLRKLNKPAHLREVIQAINRYEDEADAIFASAVADLFDTLDNPVEIIKLKEVYVALETATDKCVDVADVLETILIKHA